MAPIRVTPAAEQSKLPAFKVVKPGIKRNTKKLSKALQKPTPPPGRRYSAKIRADGLLDLEDTPDYLVAAVKRNSVESPLLRLDEGIRRKIWELAMGGQTIEISLRKVELVKKIDTVDKILTVDKTNTVDETEPPNSTEPATKTEPINKSGPVKKSTSASKPIPSSPYIGKPIHNGPKHTKPKTAFHLPEVCRQIYTETSTLAYSLNQFAFTGEVEAKFGREDGPDGALESWCHDLLPAQRNAITYIRPHWHDVQDYLDKRNMWAFKQLRIPSRVVNCAAKWPSRGDPMRRLLRLQAKEQIAGRVKEQEGEDVEAVF